MTPSFKSSAGVSVVRVYTTHGCESAHDGIKSSLDKSQNCFGVILLRSNEHRCDVLKDQHDVVCEFVMRKIRKSMSKTEFLFVEEDMKYMSTSITKHQQVVHPHFKDEGATGRLGGMGVYRENHVEISSGFCEQAQDLVVPLL